MNKKEMIEKLKKLPVISKAENTWVNKKLVPITFKLVELDKVIALIQTSEQDILKEEKQWITDHMPNKKQEREDEYSETLAVDLIESWQKQPSEKIYKKIHIKSEADLPKQSGYYVTWSRNDMNLMIVRWFISYRKSEWDNVISYLVPIEH